MQNASVQMWPHWMDVREKHTIPKDEIDKNFQEVYLVIIFHRGQ